MSDPLAKPDPRDKRLHDRDRKVRMKEKLRRMPDGVFTFAGHLQGIPRKIVQEDIVDQFLQAPEPKPMVIELTAKEKFLARFQVSAARKVG